LFAKTFLFVNHLFDQSPYLSTSAWSDTETPFPTAQLLPDIIVICDEAVALRFRSALAVHAPNLCTVCINQLAVCGV